MLVLLVGCSGITPTTGSDEAPVQVVKQFVSALRSKNASKMVEYLANNEAIGGYAPELQTTMDLLQTMNIENEQYTLQENDGTNAKVKMTATISYAVRGVPLVTQQGDAIFSLINVADQWLIRNIEPVLPEGLGK